MKVALLLLACLAMASGQSVFSNVAFSSTTSCLNGCTLASILTDSVIQSILTGGANLNLDFTALQAGSSVTITSSLLLGSAITVNSLVAGNANTVNVAAGFTVNTAGLFVQGSSSAVVAGTVVLQNTVAGATNFTVEAGSSLYVQSTGSINAGASNVQAAGSANVAGAITTTGSYTQASGTLVLNSTGNTQATATAAVTAAAVTISSGATLVGNGVIGAANAAASAGVTVTVSGTIAIGNSPGTVTINGDWRPQGTSIFKLEVASSSSYDKLFVTGKAYINGGLQVTLLDNYIPGDNGQFPFLTAAGGTTGSFSTTIGTNANSITKWSSPVTATQVVATYNSAVTVAISGLVLVACVLASLL